MVHEIYALRGGVPQPGLREDADQDKELHQCTIRARKGGGSLASQGGTNEELQSMSSPSPSVSIVQTPAASYLLVGASAPGGQCTS